MIYKTNYNCLMGNYTLISDGKYLIGLWKDNQNYNYQTKITQKDDLHIFIKTKNWLDRYFDGKVVDINELSIKFIGTTFQKEVWKTLCEIPTAETRSYNDIALAICKKRKIAKMSNQAIGQAVGKNPISIIVPCHRVIGKNGKLTGYAGGLETKAKLLKHEQNINKISG